MGTLIHFFTFYEAIFVHSVVTTQSLISLDKTVLTYLNQLSLVVFFYIYYVTGVVDSFFLFTDIL